MLQTILLFPIEALGIQSVFESLFSLTHNGGTWFISCILICYLIYPALQELLIRMLNKTKLVLLILIVFVLLYSPFVVWYFDLSSIYSNPFFRLLEFFIGAIIASMKDRLDESKIIKKYVYNWTFVFCTSVLMIFGVTLAEKLHIAVGNYMLYSWVCLPCFIALMISLSGVSFKSMGFFSKRIILYFSETTYCLFLAQLFSNKISRVVIQQYHVNSNWAIAFIAWGICIIITVLLHEGIEKRFKIHFKRLFKE